MAIPLLSLAERSGSTVPDRRHHHRCLDRRPLRWQNGSAGGWSRREASVGRVGIVLVALALLAAAGQGPAASAAIAYPSYDHARVLGAVGHARDRVALTFDDCGDP